MPNTTSVAGGPMEQKAHVLLVDDQQESLLALETTLADLGAVLLKARSGGEALRYLPDEYCALVLLDIQMPGPDGFETAQRIWAADRSRHTPIIFLSSEQGGELAARAYRLGGVDYLVKPVLPEVLR